MLALGREDLNAGVGPIADIDLALALPDVMDEFELARTVSRLAPRKQECAGGAVFVDAGVAVGLHTPESVMPPVPSQLGQRVLQVGVVDDLIDRHLTRQDALLLEPPEIRRH